MKCLTQTTKLAIDKFVSQRTFSTQRSKAISISEYLLITRSGMKILALAAQIDHIDVRDLLAITLADGTTKLDQAQLELRTDLIFIADDIADTYCATYV